MSEFQTLLGKYADEMKNIGVSSYDANLLEKVAKGLGPSIYNLDAALVSCSDQEEKDRVKNNFLIKKLGLSDGAELDTAINEVCEQFGSSNRNKYRVIFYYLLVEKFNKQSVYA